MTFDRRADALARMFAEAEQQAGVLARAERRAEWHALLNAVIDSHDRLGDLELAVHSAVSLRYGDLDADERETLAHTLTLVFQHWGKEGTIEDVRHDRRNILPPELWGLWGEGVGAHA